MSADNRRWQTDGTSVLRSGRGRWSQRKEDGRGARPSVWPFRRDQICVAQRGCSEDAAGEQGMREATGSVGKAVGLVSITGRSLHSGGARQTRRLVYVRLILS